MMVCGEPHRNEKITPGASTVAKFKTLILMVLEDFSSSQTERQVNALIMSCLFTHPISFVCGHKTHKKARRVLRHGSIGIKRMDTPSQIIRGKSTIIFPNKRK